VIHHRQVAAMDSATHTVVSRYVVCCGHDVDGSRAVKMKNWPGIETHKKVLKPKHQAIALNRLI
jgi:hypothetical protein